MHHDHIQEELQKFWPGPDPGRPAEGTCPRLQPKSVTATVACRDESDVQLAGNDRGLAGGADVTATQVAWSKTTAALRAE